MELICMPDKQNNPKYCPVSVTQNILMGKWKLAILWIISQRTRRFNELQKLMPKVSRGVLTQQLRELERDQLLHREVYREVPPKVEYSLTETGKSFIPVMLQIMEWVVGYVKATANCNMDICISNKFSCYRCYEMLKTGEIQKLSSTDGTEDEMI
jgi:DNA-binding HxlR family transcriptional regulator